MFRVDAAIVGSFCRCRNGSPVTTSVPDTMFTLCPGTTVWADKRAIATAMIAATMTRVKAADDTGRARGKSFNAMEPQLLLSSKRGRSLAQNGSARAAIHAEIWPAIACSSVDDIH